MTTQTYTAKSGAKLYRPVMTQSEYLQLDNESVGFCLACGETRDGCEPDARNYECESCGSHKVYGIEELLLMGLLKIA